MILSIHLRSPQADPFKVPRPFIVDTSVHATAGGEIGPCQVIGVAPTVDDHLEEFETIEQFAASVADPDSDALDYVRGWYVSVEQGGICYTVDLPIERVEVHEDHQALRARRPLPLASSITGLLERAEGIVR